MISTIDDGGNSGSQSGSSEFQVTTASDAPAAGGEGPSLAVSFSDGSTVELDAEDLKLYLLAIQTFLLVYVAYKEVSN